jgi:hypothetical protein
MLILENLARAFSPGEVERGLMNSPGHRANILNRDVTRVGVGVVFDARAKNMLVTQLFAKPPEKWDPHTIDELRRGLGELRRGRKLRALERDVWLDELAQSTALKMAQHGMVAAEAGRRIGAELQTRPESWATGHCVFAVGGDIADLLSSTKESLADPAATHAAVGVAPGRTKEGGSGLFVVIVLATHR